MPPDHPPRKVTPSVSQQTAMPSKISLFYWQQINLRTLYTFNTVTNFSHDVLSNSLPSINTVEPQDNAGSIPAVTMPPQTHSRGFFYLSPIPQPQAYKRGQF